MGGQRHAPAALPLGKRHGTHSIGGWVGPGGRNGGVRKTSPPPGFDPRTVQPVASRYTNYAIPAHILWCGTGTGTYRNWSLSRRVVDMVNRLPAGRSGVRIFFLFQNVQTGSVVYPTSSYPVGTGVPSSVAKRPDRKFNRSSPSNSEVINEWRYVVGSKSFRPDIQKPRQM